MNANTVLRSHLYFPDSSYMLLEVTVMARVLLDSLQHQANKIEQVKNIDRKST